MRIILQIISPVQAMPPSASDPLPFERALFVSNLDWSIDDSLLRKTFSSAGEVVDARVIRFHTFPQRSRGFGFVSFAQEEHARRAVAELHGVEVEGRCLIVQNCEPREPRFPKPFPGGAHERGGEWLLGG